MYYTALKSRIITITVAIAVNYLQKYVCLWLYLDTAAIP